MLSVIADLEIWGPDATASPSLSVAEAEQSTWNLATSHYENFPVISWAVPKRLRQHFANVYAFCRWADDLGDEIESTDESLRLLDWWQAELEKCYQGDAQHPVYIALRETIQQFAIPIEPFSDLISAFVQDQTVCEYETFTQLQDYCRRSANPVGRIVLHLAGRANEANLLYSDSICTGLQLANFWQDVQRDFEIGRIYLPREDRLNFDYSDAAMQQQQTNEAFRRLMAFQVDRARQFLCAGEPLVSTMPGRLKIDIDLFIRGGKIILSEIERIRFDVWRQRPVVRKSQLLLAALQSCLGIIMFRK